MVFQNRSILLNIIDMTAINVCCGVCGNWTSSWNPVKLYCFIPDSEVTSVFCDSQGRRTQGRDLSRPSGLKGRRITAQGKGACAVALGYG